MLKLKVLLVFIGAGTKWCVTMKDPKENQFDNYDADDSFLFFILRKDLDNTNNYYKLAICYEKGFGSIIDTKIYNSQDDEIKNLNLLNADKIINITREIALKQPVSSLARLMYKAFNNKLSLKDFMELFDIGNDTIIEKLCWNEFLSKEQFLFLFNKNDINIDINLCKGKSLKPWMQVMLFNRVKTKDSNSKEKYSLFDELSKNKYLIPSLYDILILWSKKNKFIYDNLKKNNNQYLQSKFK